MRAIGLPAAALDHPKQMKLAMAIAVTQGHALTKQQQGGVGW